MTAHVSKDHFKAVMGSFAGGVTVVATVDKEGKLWGLTATAFSSLSMEPPLCLVCIDHKSGSYDALKKSRKFSVNVLSDKQEEISNRFASRREDKFERIEWEKGAATECPIFPHSLAWMECEVTHVVPAGDHDIFIGELKSVGVNEGLPLLYWRGAYGDINSRPKKW